MNTNRSLVLIHDIIIKFQDLDDLITPPQSIKIKSYITRDQSVISLVFLPFAVLDNGCREDRISGSLSGNIHDNDLL